MYGGDERGQADPEKVGARSEEPLQEKGAKHEREATEDSRWLRLPEGKNIGDITSIEEIQKLLGEKYHISILTTDNFFTNPHSLAKTILLEGISIITKKSLADNFNLNTKVIYTYDTSKELSKKKVQFSKKK